PADLVQPAAVDLCLRVRGVEPQGGTQPHLREKCRLENRVRHPTLAQAIFDGALRALQREVDVDARKRDQDKVFDARGGGGGDEVQLSLAIDALDEITLLARQRRRRSRNDRTYAAARR